jgi:hypothetical protein
VNNGDIETQAGFFYEYETKKNNTRFFIILVQTGYQVACKKGVVVTLGKIM